MRQQKPFSELEFRDAFMFAAVMEDEDICRDVLERVLGIPIKAVKVQAESVILMNPEHRGIRMDVFADDEAGTVFDVEMQTTNKGNLPRRSRCYQGQMDVAALEPGEGFEKLPRSFIIFICTFDPFGKGLYRYTYVPSCQENGDLLDDGTSRIFLSTKGKNQEQVPSELVAFLKYVETSEAPGGETEDAVLKKLQTRIEYLKKSRRLEERYMLFGEMLDDERKLGREEGRVEGKAEGLMEGKAEGRIEGMEEGRKEGQTEILKLITAMYAEGRGEEIIRLQTDAEFREAMLKEYHLDEAQREI